MSLAKCERCGNYSIGSICERCRSQPDPKDQRIAELEVKMTHLHDACARLKDVFASLSAERDSMERRARTYDAANTKLIAERDRLRERVGELEASRDNFRRAFERQADDATRLEAERNAARAECEERQQKYARASALTEQHHADAQKYYESNQRLEAECQTWKTRAERMGDRAEHAHEANQRMEAQAARMWEALQAACRDPLTPECRYCGVHVLRGHASDCFVGRALAEADAGSRALGCVEALRYVLDHSNEPGVVREARHALDAYDQAMSPPSTRSADVSLKAENGDTSGGETPGGDG